MKERIFSALKLAVVDAAGKTNISERTLNAYAERLSAQITDESQIAEAIKPDIIVLKEISGNISAVAAEAVKAVKPVKETPEKQVEKAVDPNEPEWFKSYREKQDQETLSLKNKLEGYDKEKTQSQLQGKITAKLKEKGIPESYLKGRNLLVETEDGIDQLVNTIEGDYTGFKQEMAEQGVFISVPPVSTGSKAGEALGQSIAEKRNTGSSEGIQGKKIV